MTYIHTTMEVLLSFLFASVVLTLSPGPDLLMVISQSLDKGFQLAVQFIMGLVSGIFLHTLVLVFGWGKWIGDSPVFVNVMKGIGCVYFIFLGLSAIRNSSSQQKSRGSIKSSHTTPYYRGLIMNVINPKVSLFFWLFFPGFLFSSSLSLAQQYAFLGAVFLLQAFCVFTTVAYFCRFFKRYTSQIKTGLYNGILWIALGFYLLIS